MDSDGCLRLGGEFPAALGDPPHPNVLAGRRTLRRVQAAGVRVVLVTARPPRTARLLARTAGVDGLVICCNGALVYDLTREAVVAHVPLPPETARTVVAALRAAVPGACFAVELGTAYGWEP